MANYGDFKGSYDKMISLLKAIERHTKCAGCGGGSPFSSLTVTPIFSAGCTNSGYLAINGLTIGTPVNAIFANLAAFVTALNVAYSGVALFVLNLDNTITVVANVGPGLTFNTSFVC